MNNSTPHPPAAGRRELPRVLGFTSVVGILVGTVIGSGIFVAPNRIASLVESPQLIMAVWIVGGVLSFFGALAFAELGAAYPQAGGMYVYLREGYGRLIAFLHPKSTHGVLTELCEIPGDDRSREP